MSELQFDAFGQLFELDLDRLVKSEHDEWVDERVQVRNDGEGARDALVLRIKHVQIVNGKYDNVEYLRQEDAAGDEWEANDGFELTFSVHQSRQVSSGRLNAMSAGRLGDAWLLTDGETVTQAFAAFSSRFPCTSREKFET